MRNVKRIVGKDITIDKDSKYYTIPIFCGTFDGLGNTIDFSNVETKITFEDSKIETVSYSTNSVLMEYLSDEELWGKSIMAILDRGTIEDILNAETESPIQTFVKDNKIASYSNTNDSTQEKTLQQIVQIDGNTPFIKSLQLYTKTAYKKDGVAVNSSNSSSDETLLNYSNASVCKITITTTLLGFASRPSDYHKYL